MATHRRHIANLVQKPTTQTKQAMSIFALVFLSTVVVQVVLVGMMMAALTDAAMISGIEPAQIQGVFGDRLADYSLRIIFIFPILALAAMFLALRISHRYLGPQVPIRRHISALIDGDYASRCCLRAGDEFWEVADELNELAERLSERHGAEDLVDAAFEASEPEANESEVVERVVPEIGDGLAA